MDLQGLPVCELDDIQPATTTFNANVPDSGRSPYPAEGKLYAFNGEFNKPAILAHVYGVRPAPTSFTLSFLLTRTKGTFGTNLEVTLPKTAGEGFITGISLDLSKSFTYKGKKHSFAAASCPAPKGVKVAGFASPRPPSPSSTAKR